ncbi:MAG: winged helix-turn-helix domain-containing protein [Bauldia sp.]|nr:winged helix-turn-helix domain-containing protein [Bauldia sp.]
MSAGSVYRFGPFSLDVADRRLTRDGATVELAPRTFDALALLVSEVGRLVPKARFFEEVWGEIAVGDEALTQCIKTLRQKLGDEASNPRFILTVPKHGYRFVAEVRVGPPATAAPNAGGDHGSQAATVPVRPPAFAAPPAVEAPVAGTAMALPVGVRPGIMATAVATAIGGAAAGLVGGVLYGILLIGPADAEIGRTSLSALLLALNAMVGSLGGLGLGLGFGIAAALSGHAAVRIAAAALGGLAVGTLSRLLGVDAFNLVLGEGPVGITGGVEGAALSGLVVLGFLAARSDRARLFGAAAGGGVAGVLIVALGGRLMAGSLERIAETFADSRALAPLAPFFENAAFGVGPELLLGGFEGAVFGAGIGAALVIAARRARFWRSAR